MSRAAAQHHRGEIGRPEGKRRTQGNGSQSGPVEAQVKCNAVAVTPRPQVRFQKSHIEGASSELASGMTTSPPPSITVAHTPPRRFSLPFLSLHPISSFPPPPPSLYQLSCHYLLLRVEHLRAASWTAAHQSACPPCPP
ncbi:hypothetical protein BDZ90DRAFT_158377 [Jaminaea rosea]|uniref:Uncharacterized protein n=1 Tax=Jaminaea rosea TaxID=1569628 RepID=A0A316URM6_9BASI|nr:hypothetical protein BDZ90DRAFT_158377 [Jaminaea rosea]PWN27970.1 hypothetical protein BDZ90DRAFT_158377 [Jaminaea rosea]